jgi:hypothetical protein
VLAPHLGEPRLVLVTSGLGAGLCAYIVADPSNKQPSRECQQCSGPQAALLPKLDYGPPAAAKSLATSRGGAGGREVFLHQTNDQVWSLVGSCVSSCMG